MMQEASEARAAAKVAAVGLDFGTTNSAIAVVGADGSPRLARFPAAESGDQTETFRSILFFEAPEETGGTDSAVSVGNDAIRRYLAAAGNGRLVQSLKSFLADKTFESTDIMGETYTLGDLIAPIITRAPRRGDRAVRRVAAANRRRTPGPFRSRRQSRRGPRA